MCFREATNQHYNHINIADMSSNTANITIHFYGKNAFNIYFFYIDKWFSFA